MTDEMTVQAQRPSAVPYVLGGTALGGIAGAGAAAANVGLKSPVYKTWEDAVKAETDKDSFVSKQIEKGGDNKANWEEIKTQAEAVKKAEQTLADVKLPSEFKGKEALDDVLAKEATVADSEKKLFDKVKEHYKTLKLESGYGIPAEAGDIPEAIKTKYGINDARSINEENFRNLLSSTEKTEQEFAEKILKRTSEYTGSFAEGATDTAKAVAKTEREALTTAKTNLEKAEETLNGKEGFDKLTAELRTKYSDAKKGLEAAKKTADEKLSKDLLDKCKKASTWKNALVGAAVLGLAGLLVRPKGEEV